jgi:hypothetical protein
MTANYAASMHVSLMQVKIASAPADTETARCSQWRLTHLRSIAGADQPMADDAFGGTNELSTKTVDNSVSNHVISS